MGKGIWGGELMLRDRTAQQKSDKELPIVDEGWWASVLSDEDVYQGEEVLVTNRQTPTMISEPVDWEFVKQIFDRDEIIELQVHAYNRGGLLVQGKDVQGFVPISHLVGMQCSEDEQERRTKLANYVGRTMQLKVIECEPNLERIVFSERAALSGKGQRKQLFHSLRTGDLVCGVVTNVTDFGVFIDLGGVEGLVHVSEISWGRVQHPSEVMKVGDEVKALVLQISEENTRVALSIKRLEPNPWIDLELNHKPGDVVPATITGIRRFGAFARLDEGVEGLIHVSSIGNGNDHRPLESLFKPGQVVEVKILHIDAERRRLGLGLVGVG